MKGKWHKPGGESTLEDLEAAEYLRMWKRFSFQQIIHPKHKAGSLVD